MLAVVVNGSDLVKRNTCLVEALGHPSGVGVYNLTDEEFVANGDD